MSEVGLLTSCTILDKSFRGGQDAHPTTKFTLCGTGILPVLDNGATFQITNSKLQHYIDDRGLRGVLSNFHSLQAAIEEKKYAIAEPQILWDSVGWRNLMLRIPAAQIMLSVIAQLICDRINVNATLVFSQTTYEQVEDAYLRGLESFIQQGESVSEIACFSSFSIGRLDAVIPPLLEKIKIRGECFSLTPTIFCPPFNQRIAAINRQNSRAIATR